MSHERNRDVFAEAWPAMARTALRVAFGLIWVADAAFTWTSGFAVHYVGYLHNAAQGQPAWLARWFDVWIALVTPRAAVFVWGTRIVETLLAAALLLGFARKTVYVLGALFSLLIWSTAEGFGGPYTVGATNMGAGIVYVLVFFALGVINSGSGPSPYSLDYYMEKRWPGWRRVSEWRTDVRPATVHAVSWRVQAPALAGIALLVFFLIASLHSSLNVRPPTPASAAAAVSPLSLASNQPIGQPRDARLPPVQPGPAVKVDVVATDRTVAIASGVQYQAWTFNDIVPAPVIHVRQGQTVNVTFINRGTMQHSLDFHSAMTPPSLHYVELRPGEAMTYSFVAKVAGAFIYHCGTPPVLLHIGNGMYGAIVVDPAAPLPPVSESYVLVQGEWYTQQVSGTLMGADYQKMLNERPDEVVFNGAAFQYRDHPLRGTPGGRVRLYFVNAGPNIWSSFHVIGAIYDRVYPDGDPAHALTGVSSYTVGPGDGAVFDLVIDEPGRYPFVDHDMAHAMIGAQGILAVGQQTAVPPVTASAPAAAAATPPAAPAATSASSGPYTFDRTHGAALYASTCAACHQPTGTGLPAAFPPLKGNAVVLDADPTKHISVVLNGLSDEAIDGVSYPTVMPPFGSSLSDTDVADLVNHERTSWDNQGRLVTAEQVKAVRARGTAK
jgi:nitrite reductase (NO-forming)